MFQKVKYRDEDSYIIDYLNKHLAKFELKASTNN